jgi:hypothetical protein
MKKYLFGFAAVIALGFSACTEKDPIVEPPSINGNWKLSKMKLVFYVDNYIDFDTTLIGPKFFGEEYFTKYNADNTLEQTTISPTGQRTIDNGTYNLTGSTMTHNFLDLTTEQFENVTVDAKQLIMTQYDPSKTDPNRSVITIAYERQ